MSKKNTLLIVVAAALIKDKKILFQRRPANKSMPFLWELPGGKIKTNETPERALCRELFEELGINIKINDLLPLTFVSYTYPSFNLLMLVYICKKWKGNFLLKENQKINFYNKHELIEIDMLEADKSLIDPLREILS